MKKKKFTKRWHKKLFSNSFTLSKIFTSAVSVSEKLLQLYIWYISTLISVRATCKPNQKKEYIHTYEYIHILWKINSYQQLQQHTVKTFS